MSEGKEARPGLLDANGGLYAPGKIDTTLLNETALNKPVLSVCQPVIVSQK
jgi:hypothetical protein